MKMPKFRTFLFFNGFFLTKSTLSPEPFELKLKKKGASEKSYWRLKFNKKIVQFFDIFSSASQPPHGGDNKISKCLPLGS